jgi:hypothetical protein
VQFLLPRKRKRKEIGEKSLSFEVFLFGCRRLSGSVVAASSSVVCRRQPLRHRFCRAMIFLSRGAWHVPVKVDLRLPIPCFRNFFFPLLLS